MAAWLVSLMVALPLLVAPFRALIGFRSDTHRSVLGWRRVPYIWIGTLLQFGGLAIMPFALLVLSGDGQLGRPGSASSAPALAFLLVGAGLQTTQTAGLALATDLAPGSIAPARGGADVRDAAARHGRRRHAVRRAAGRLLRQEAGPGGAGRGRAERGPEHRRAVEAGGAPARRDGAASRCPRRPSAPMWRSFIAQKHARGASCGRWRWARWPSTCRTSCSSPTAARSSA